MKVLLVLICLVFLLVTTGISRDVKVTVYNSNIGVVKDSRATSLESGTSVISMDEIASRIDPTSVKLTISGRGSPEVLEQNFGYDLVSPDKVLTKYLEHVIHITTEDGTDYNGTLLGFDTRNLVLSLDRGEVAMVSRLKVTDIVLPALETGLIVKPTLFWTVSSTGAKHAEMEVAYITEGLNWHAEYVATLGQDDDYLGLASWVSVENQSGATYPEATLKLIAGDVHRAEEKRRMPAMAPMEADFAAAPRLEEKAFFEYHMYTLDGKTTLKDKEVKQIQLFPEKEVTARKQYNFDARTGGRVRVIMRFENSSSSGLGIPLPQGKVRVFKADEDGSLEFLGEDLIDHTPKDEEVKLYIGNAFDIIARRERTDFTKVSDRVVIETFEITLSNHKDTDIAVTVTEYIYGDWDIRSKSHPYEKLRSNEIEFEVPVEADGETVLTYTVRRKV
jgi:hypothetical protein